MTKDEARKLFETIKERRIAERLLRHAIEQGAIEAADEIADEICSGHADFYFEPRLGGISS